MAGGKKKRKNSSTKTSSFGSSGRISHDSSSFYASRLYEGLPQEDEVDLIENILPEDILDTIIHGSSENMEDLPDNSIHLMVTSPPYNVGKEYDDNFSLREYLDFLNRVWREVYRVLVPGGRACINVANLGRKPYIPLTAFIIEGMIDVGFLMRGEIIWAKGSSAGSSTAWGSWMSPSNPTLRDTHEYVLVFSKNTYRRNNVKEKTSTISKEDFLELTKSVWTFQAESAKKVGHPAPFPVELPHRLIQLYTYEGDVILDPFIGSGQTAIAAIKANRHYVGYDIEKEYCQMAEKRIYNFTIEYKSQTLFDLDNM